MSADRHARAVRGHRYRVPGPVSRSLAVDVGAHLGPRPAALSVHAHVAGVCRRCRRCIGADRHARAVRGHRYRDPDQSIRSLAIDVRTHLGPVPAALDVDEHAADRGAVPRIRLDQPPRAMRARQPARRRVSTDAACCAAKRAPRVCPPSMPTGSWSRAFAPTTSAASIASAGIARWTSRGILAGPSRAPRATICARPFDPWA